MEPRIAVSSSDLTCKFYSTHLGKHLLSARPQRWGPLGSYSHQPRDGGCDGCVNMAVCARWGCSKPGGQRWKDIGDVRVMPPADSGDRKCVCAVEAEWCIYSFFVSQRISEHSLYMARPCVKCSWATKLNYNLVPVSKETRIR